MYGIEKIKVKDEEVNISSKEDDADKDLGKYRKALSQSDEEIKDMNSSIETELFDLLATEEPKNFDLATALKRIDKTMEAIG
jgi:hypothetical protein